jgi:cytochrome c5
MISSAGVQRAGCVIPVSRDIIAPCRHPDRDRVFPEETMSQSHHPDAIEQNIETHPVKLALMVGGGAIALVVGIILLAQFAVTAYGGRSLKDSPAMAPEAVAKRIGPVAKLMVDSGGAPAPATQAAAPVAVATVAAPQKAGKTEASKGKAIYEGYCMACHGAGVAGSPKFGDKAAWAPRIKSGMEALYGSALKGKGAMPPKGGNTSLADADVKAAVDYMVAAAK